MYDWRCCHSCNVKWPEVGIASRSVFSASLRDKLLLDRWKGLISPEHHSWMFHSKGKVEDDVLNLNNPFGKLVHFLFPFKMDAVPVGKVENTQEVDHLATRFDLLDDQVWHGIRCECLSLDLLSGHQAEKLVSPLQVSSGAKHYRLGGGVEGVTMVFVGAGSS